MNEEAYYPTTYWHLLSGHIEWRRYKHPADGHRATRGGNIIPDVVEARHYVNSQTGQAISAVFSYPKGIGLIDDYFWEIYPTFDGNIERFTGPDGESKMEETIAMLLYNPTYKGMNL